MNQIYPDIKGKYDITSTCTNKQYACNIDKECDTTFASTMHAEHAQCVFKRISVVQNCYVCARVQRLYVYLCVHMYICVISAGVYVQKRKSLKV